MKCRQFEFVLILFANINLNLSQSGIIAHELEFVNHHVRTKLDELKRTELERLRHLATREYELENGLDKNHLKIPEHLDHSNPHTFEIDDLKKLIAKVWLHNLLMHCV